MPLEQKQLETWLLPVAVARLSESLPDHEKKQLLRIAHTRLRLVKRKDRSLKEGR